MVLPPDQMPPVPLKTPASRIRLNERDLRKLRRIINRPESSSLLILSAKVVQLAAQGLADEAIAGTLKTFPGFVCFVVQRFTRSRFVSLQYELKCIPPIAAPDAISDSGAHREAIRITLLESERLHLEQIVRAHTSEQRMALRADIILHAGLGWDNCKVADKLAVNVKTVRKWRKRYAQSGYEGLYDEVRPGRPFRFDATARHELFTAVVGPAPEPYAAWSLDLLAKHLVDKRLVGSISIETVSYWLRTADIKPHRVRGWLNCQDPNFREKRDKIVELYLHPPKDGVLLSVDEKTGIQALERIRKDQPAAPGQRRRVEWEYKRHGTANLIASFNVSTGQIISEILDGKNDSDAFIKFLEKLMQFHPEGKVYLILDNGTTHRSEKTKAFFDENKRLVPVFTPTHASWLNQIEIWFSVLSRQALRKVSFSSLDLLRARIEAYIALHNRELAMPYEWSTKGKPLTGVSAKERRRRRNLSKEVRNAA
jgi:transposase